MGPALTVYVPLFAFMLIPVWIPLIAVSLGAVADRIRPTRPGHALSAVREAKARTAALRDGGHRAHRAHAARSQAPVVLSRRGGGEQTDWAA